MKCHAAQPCVSAAALLMCCIVNADTLDASAVKLDIEQQPVLTALRQLSEQTGLQLLIPVNDVALSSATSQRVAGLLTARAALENLLAQTGLEYEVVNGRTVQIGPLPPHATAASRSVKEFRLAEAAPASAQDVDAARSSSGSELQRTKGIQEVIVTASRREQLAQDAPASLQVFAGADLERNGVDGFADYLATVPGLSFRDQGNGANKISLRGISNVGSSDGASGTVSTTGFYVNDVPVQGTSVAPDLSLYDVQRIEVLKGPQGTLYGDGAMGGAIKMILNPPNLQKFEGKADVALSSTENGGGNYRMRSAVNLPLVQDRAALRVVGTYLEDSGFIDNIARNNSDDGGRRSYSFRAALGMSFTETLSAELLALYNSLHQDGFPQIQTALGGYRLSSAEDRYNDIDAAVVGLTIRKDFGFAELTSVSSVYDLDREFVETLRFASAVFGAYGRVSADPFYISPEVRSYAQELRIVSASGDRFDWVAGAFYRDRKQDSVSSSRIPLQDVAGVNAGLTAATLPPAPVDGVVFLSNTASSAKQYAMYAEGNLHLTDYLTLTAGLRWFDEKSEAVVQTTGYSLLAANTSAPTTVHLDDDGVVPKVVLSVDLTDKSLLYAQAAKGFRSGAPNLNVAFGGDEGAESDSLWSYELGLKNSFAQNRIILNVAVFNLDWTDIQTVNVVPNRINGGTIGVIDNAGDGEIYGFEAELAASLGRGFSTALSAGYTHTELTRTLGTALVRSKLPNTSTWTASGYGEYRVPLAGGELFGRGDVQYVGSQNTTLLQVNAAGVITNNGFPMPSHVLGSIRLGWESDSEWGGSLFVDNVSNNKAIIGRGYESLGNISQNTRLTVMRPRTYGLSFFKNF